MTWSMIQSIENELLDSTNTALFNVNSNGNVFIDGEYVCTCFVTMYNAWMFPVYTVGGKIHNLELLWVKYIAEWQHSIDSMYTALYTDYKPLNNYDMTENESVGRKIDKTTTTPSSTTTQEYKSTTFDDSTLRPVDETTNTVQMETTVTPANSQTIPDIAGAFNNGEIRKLTRSGNIGVTTSQQMIESELELRKKSVANWLIEFFVKQYMYMVTDGENDE